MACLFCGKEIGALRLLRDTEFCSPKHRKEYKDRLRKVLVQVGEPQTVPTQIAPFQDTLRAYGGPRHKSAASFDFSTVAHTTELPRGWTLAIPDAGGTGSLLAQLELTAVELSSAGAAPRSLANPLLYFGKTATSLLSAPPAELGPGVLRTAAGQLLSDPIGLPYPDPRLDSRPVESASAPAQQIRSLALPEFVLSVAECEELIAAAEPPPSEMWMAPPPEPVQPASEPALNVPQAAATQLHIPEVVAPTAPPAAQPAPVPGPCEAWFPVSAPAAATAEARLSLSCVPLAPIPAAPALAGLEIPSPLLPASISTWMSLADSAPATREVAVSAVPGPVAFSPAPLRLAAFSLEVAPEAIPDLAADAPDPYTAEPEKPMAPPRAAGAKSKPLSPVNSAPASPIWPVSQPAAPASVSMPAASTERPQTEVPQFGFFAVDYRTAAGLAAPRPKLIWASRFIPVEMPRFVVRPVFDRLEDQSTQKQQSKRPAFAEIFTMPDAAALTRRKGARHAFTAIAASVTVFMALWFGANAGKFGRDLLSRQAAGEIAAAARLHTETPGDAPTGSVTARAVPPPADPLKHPVAWVRSEAAKRATVQLADNFENGMAAWGVKGKAWAPGWSHSSDGYVRPGQLALFQPTLSYTDYRMDFFGQIENKSMSWVVRGKDTQNYYAMKFSITEPGLRPTISMAHFPVVGGKQGHKVVVPLSVMVHNNTAYHVAVVVKGSHYTASIEGQEVDSWSDDTLLAGGVGFFAEAGARARIYWMKVSKNDDWFGRLCDRIAGVSEPRDSAWFQPPAMPIPQPERPAPLPAAALLLPADAGETGFGKLQRGKGSWKGEIEKWSS